MTPTLRNAAPALAVALTLACALTGGCTRDSRTQTSESTPAEAPTPVRAHVRAASPSAAETPAAPSSLAPTKADNGPTQSESARLRQEFADLSAKIQELRARAAAVSSTRTRERVAAIVSELEEKRRTLADQMEHLDDWRTSASLAWQDIRIGLERALRELRDSYEKAKSHF